MRFETLILKAGGEVDYSTGAVAPPIHLSTTYEHSPEGEKIHGYSYIREQNPTQDRLEFALAALEAGEAALCYASGMAAGTAVFLSLPRGSHILFSNDIYFAFRMLADSFFEKWGLEVSFVDTRSLAAVASGFRKNTRLLWLESPSNPRLQLADIERLSEMARAHQILTLVDNTFATPVLQQPLSLGADIVLHSATKYLGGHSDVQGGALIMGKGLYDEFQQIRKLTGGVLSPFNAWLILRGLRTLAVRVMRSSQSALFLARELSEHPRVSQVHYPGLQKHPGYELVQRQMRAPGGMLSIEIKGGREAALAMARKLEYFTNATSLGGVESLVEHRASIEGSNSQTPAGLLRLSIGLEDPEDLLDDLIQALEG